MHIAFISEQKFEHPDNRIAEYIDLESIRSEKDKIITITRKLAGLKGDDNTFFIDKSQWILFWYILPQLKHTIIEDCFVDIVYKNHINEYESKRFALTKEQLLN